MIDFAKLKKDCPFCLGQWKKWQNDDYFIYSCSVCLLDFCPDYGYVGSWLRRRFAHFMVQKEGVSCFYWTNYLNHNLYYDDHGIRHDFNSEINIPLDIAQSTLETLINFQ